MSLEKDQRIDELKKELGLKDKLIDKLRNEIEDLQCYSYEDEIDQLRDDIDELKDYIVELEQQLEDRDWMSLIQSLEAA